MRGGGFPGFSTGGGSRRRRNVGCGGGIGGILLLVVLFVVLPLMGVDVTRLLGGAGLTGSSSGNYADEDFSCTGAEANQLIDCRIEGAAVTLEQYWTETAPELGITNYSNPMIYLFENSTQSACGTASNAVGPFYCPADESIYIDTEFFQIMETQFGASGGSLSELYVVAHEWAHHIQHLTGVLSSSNTRDQGATGGAVRTELQADCYAGAWMQSASQATDAEGNQIMREPTQEEIATTISAAQSIGDDHLQEQAGMEVQPESFSHGTSEQRVNWLMRGYEQGATACNTFTVPDSEL